MALLSGAVALVSYRYLLGRGPVPDQIAANAHVDPWLVIHATGAATALLLGPVQFLPGLRRRHPALHRVTGRLYVAGCVSGGASALMLASGVSAGPIAGAGFAALGTAWLVTTATATQRILVRDVAAHRRWMVRSFALTLSAVTLRLYMPAAGLIGVDHVAAHRAIAWLCWVPNALAAEWYLRRDASPVQVSTSMPAPVYHAVLEEGARSAPLFR
jgi:uncharacterized membrane protein